MNLIFFSLRKTLTSSQFKNVKIDTKIKNPFEFFVSLCCIVGLRNRIQNNIFWKMLDS
jgi:hypothetical protein